MGSGKGGNESATLPCRSTLETAAGFLSIAAEKKGPHSFAKRNISTPWAPFRTPEAAQDNAIIVYERRFSVALLFALCYVPKCCQQWQIHPSPCPGACNGTAISAASSRRPPPWPRWLQHRRKAHRINLGANKSSLPMLRATSLGVSWTMRQPRHDRGHFTIFDAACMAPLSRDSRTPFRRWRSAGRNLGTLSLLL